MPIELMFGGHGDPILDHVDLIDKRLASQDRRTEKIFDLVSEAAHRTRSPTPSGATSP